MDKEIKRRKKRFWAFCLATLLVLCNAAPMIAEAKEYSIKNYDVTNGMYIYPGDIFNYDSINANCQIHYYDINDTELAGASHCLSARNSVKSYSEAGGTGDRDSFLHWLVMEVNAQGNCVSEIKLRAESGTKRDIVYHLDGGNNDPNNPTSYVEGIGVSSFAPASKTGHDFKGWYSDVTFTTQMTLIDQGQSGNVDLYAKFEPKDYDIVYHLAGGNNASGNPTSYKYGIGVTSFGSANKAGHDFKGWYSDEGLTTPISEISATETEVVDLYAKFEPKDYGIGYHLAGGSNDPNNPTSYKYGIGVASFGSANKAGHDFKGWYSDEGLTTPISEISATETGVVDLYAKFEPKDYDIVYHLAGGNNAFGNPTSYKYGIGVTSFDSANKAGHDFKGWYSDEGLTTPISEISATQTDDVNLYAKFSPKNYQITYMLNGGSNASENPTGYVYGAGVSSFVSASRTGHTFEGWYSDAACTKKVTTISSTQYGDITLYAKYTEVVDISKENKTTKTAVKNTKPKTGDFWEPTNLPLIFQLTVMLVSGLVIVFMMIRSIRKKVK